VRERERERLKRETERKREPFWMPLQERECEKE